MSDSAKNFGTREAHTGRQARPTLHEQGATGAEFIDAPGLLPGDQDAPAQDAEPAPRPDDAGGAAPVPPAVEKVERKTSTLDNWEGEGGATPSGPVPEKMPDDEPEAHARGGSFQRPRGNGPLASGWAGPPRGVQEHTYPPNLVRPVVVSNSERLLMTAAGGALFFYGLRNPTLGRLLLGLAGMGLAYQGATGGSPVREFVLRQEVARVPLRGEPAETAAPPQRTGIRVKKSMTVNKPAEELYRYWRNLENLPRFMSHVQEVRQLDGTRSEWRVRVLRGMELEWEAEITVDRPNEMIAWETLPGARVHNRGYVKFVPAPRDLGTEVHVSLEYQPPLGPLGQAAAGMFNFITEQQVKEDIRNFKQIMEAGEIPTTEGQPQGGRL